MNSVCWLNAGRRSSLDGLLPGLACGLLCLAGGCASSGLIPARDLPAAYQAPEVRPVKVLDLAKLGRATEAEHRVQPGEMIEVSCSDLFEEQKCETFAVRVEEDGAVCIPMISKRVPVAALTAGEAEQLVRTTYVNGRLIRNPRVTVRTLEAKKKTVYVIGAVKNPGVYELVEPDECDPLRAILAAGGITEDAGTTVEVRRAPQPAAPKRPPAAPPASPSEDRVVVASLTTPAEGEKGNPEESVARFTLTGDGPVPAQDQLVLNNGDVVSVEEKKKEPFFVAGSVNKPGEFPMPTDREIHVLEAIGMGGGVNTMSQPTTVVVVRRLKGKEPVSIHVDLARAAHDPKENIPLMAGDLVRVDEDPVSQTRRFVREFLRVGMYMPLPISY